MKVLALAITLTAGLGVGYSIQDKKDAQDKKPAGGADMAMAMPVAGPEHKLLEDMAGHWDAVVKSMGSESKASEVVKLLDGGFFAVANFKGEFGGAPFAGHGVTGYDPLKQKYVMFWCDSMSPTPIFTYGAFNKDKKELTFVGDMPGMDGKLAKHTMVTKVIDKDHHDFTMSGPGPDGKDMEMMVISYTRQKK